MEEEVQQIKNTVLGKFPDAKIVDDPPEVRGGTWYMDIDFKDHRISIQVMQSMQIGVYVIGITPDVRKTVFTEGPDELYLSVDKACDRLVALLSDSKVPTLY